MDKITPIILAGGVGSRLYPVSHRDFPKQFIPILNGQSLFQKTLERLNAVEFLQPPLIVTNNHYKNHISLQLPATNNEILYEPHARNTGAATVISCMTLANRGAEYAVISPADHHIHHINRFINDMRAGFDHLRQNKHHVLFGIKPTRPSSDYGYICVDETMRVTNFHEKPNPDTADQLISTPNPAYWNSGISMVHVPSLLSDIKKQRSDFYRLCVTAYARPTPDNYLAIPSISFDHLYWENCADAHCIPATFDWADIGNHAAFNTFIKQQSKAAA